MTAPVVLSQNATVTTSLRGTLNKYFALVLTRSAIPSDLIYGVYWIGNGGHNRGTVSVGLSSGTSNQARDLRYMLEGRAKGELTEDVGDM